MNARAASPFFSSREDRLELARRRYFDDGITPVGVVSEAIFHSWTRCQRLHSTPTGQVEFQPVTPSRTHLALQKNRALVEAWRHELSHIESIIGMTSCAAMLTDPSGVLIASSCAGRSHERIMPIATRLGVDLSEEAVGTTAPGVVARTGQPMCVIAGEHFFEEVRRMHCAAAPIRDHLGRLAGVLDLSSEELPFGFDATSVVSLLARALENRILTQSAQEVLMIALQITPSLLSSPMAGLVGISGEGRILWCNGAAVSLLGLPTLEIRDLGLDVESRIGLPVERLLHRAGSDHFQLRLPSGLAVWARVSAPPSESMGPVFTVPAPQVDPATRTPPSEAPDAVCAPPPPTLAPRSLRTIDQEIIRTTLQDCGGNVSEAARRLGVSRGLIYRRARQIDATALSDPGKRADPGQSASGS